MGDKFGDRMKMYEATGTGPRLMPLLPAVVRLDGRGFSRFTKGLKRPYDERLTRMMVDLTTVLVKESGARIGYTQSDEISLLLYSDSITSQIYFDGRVFKIVSALAAMASAWFCQNLEHYIPEKAGLLPTFDCRVWNLPNQQEACNAILWREVDATKNSLSMAAREHFSHRELLRKNGSELQEMLFQKGVNWNDYPASFKRGSYVQRRIVAEQFSQEEIEKLPAKHAARRNPDLIVERKKMLVVDMPPLARVTNYIDVLFYGAQPQTAEDAA